MADPLAEAFEKVRERISAAAERAGRDPEEITLVAVTKGVSTHQIRGARALGNKDFGENRVAEATQKFDELSDLTDIQWHFVGRLQRKKVKSLTTLNPIVHSVDRLEMAAEISRRFSQPARVFLEVNVTGEAAKGGVEPEHLLSLAERCSILPNIEILGLMTMAPIVDQPEQARPYFRRLAALRDEMKKSFPGAMIHHLSMGMSQDYEVAVEEGATEVRIGRAIFGHERSSMATRRGSYGSTGGSWEER